MKIFLYFVFNIYKLKLKNITVRTGRIEDTPSHCVVTLNLPTHCFKMTINQVEDVQA